jgi:hypothetical protein
VLVGDKGHVANLDKFCFHFSAFLHKKSPAKAGLGQTLKAEQSRKVGPLNLSRLSGFGGDGVLEERTQPPTTGDDFPAYFAGWDEPLDYEMRGRSGGDFQFSRNAIDAPNQIVAQRGFGIRVGFLGHSFLSRLGGRASSTERRNGVGWMRLTGIGGGSNQAGAASPSVRNLCPFSGVYVIRHFRPLHHNLLQKVRVVNFYNEF